MLAGADRDMNYRRRQQYANPFRIPNEIESSSYSILNSVRNNVASLSIDDDITIGANQNVSSSNANQSIPSF